jgi:PTS system ascorbate-specific IIA component
VKTLADYLPIDSIVTLASVKDWREAIAVAGAALVATGATTTAYTGEMIETIENLGPYVVVAPGFALAHARPSAAVLKTGVSWVSLAEPVEFGNQANDPVQLVIALAAQNHDSHLDLMALLASFLQDIDAVRTATEARDPNRVRRILSNFS